MGIVVEILGPDDEGDFVADFGQEQQAAEHGPLGLDAPRRLAVEQLAEAVRRMRCAVFGLPWPRWSIRRNG